MAENEFTTIPLFRETRDELRKRKKHPNQSYDEILREILGLPPHETKEEAAAKEGEDAPGSQ